MPQARSSRTKSTGSKSSSKAQPAAAKGTTAAKRTTAAKGTTAAKRTATTKPAAAKRSSASTASTAGTSRASSAKSSAAEAQAKAAGAGDARLEAAARRLRKLNERIIEGGKEAGETTLSSYEKALKAIASSIESGPGKSEVEWISHLATTQAKFLRDVTSAWTAAARGVLK